VINAVSGLFTTAVRVFASTPAAWTRTAISVFAVSGVSLLIASYLLAKSYVQLRALRRLPPALGPKVGRGMVRDR
jgi:hypothetical protein